MNLINLKKTNYFRYIQIKNLNNKIIEELSLLFLFEIETFKILNSVTEPTLKKIRFQWIIEEIENEKKKFVYYFKIIKII